MRKSKAHKEPDWPTSAPPPIMKIPSVDGHVDLEAGPIQRPAPAVTTDSTERLEPPVEAHAPKQTESANKRPGVIKQWSLGLFAHRLKPSQPILST